MPLQMPEGGFRAEFPTVREESSENRWLPMSTVIAIVNVNPNSAGNPTLENAFGVYVGVVHHEASAGGRERKSGREGEPLTDFGKRAEERTPLLQLPN